MSHFLFLRVCKRPRPFWCAAFASPHFLCGVASAAKRLTPVAHPEPGGAPTRLLLLIR